jgi:hypothetical protein
MTTSLTEKRSKMYPFLTRKLLFSVANAEEVPAKGPKADARTRTGDPFITRERQVGTRVHSRAGAATFFLENSGFADLVVDARARPCPG